MRGSNIEEPSTLTSLDAGEASGRRRWDLYSFTQSSPSSACPTIICFSLLLFGGFLGDGSLSPSLAGRRRVQCFHFGVCATGPAHFWGSPHCSVVHVNINHNVSNLVNLSAHIRVLPRRKLAAVSRWSSLSIYRSSPSGSDLCWGVPQTDESLAGHSLTGAALHQSDPPPSPLPSPPPALSFPAIDLLSPDLSCLLSRRRASSTVLALSRRQVQAAQSLRLGLRTIRLGLVSPMEFNYHLASVIVSQPIISWGLLVNVTNCLKVTGGFTRIFTESALHITPHLSYRKSLLFTCLPVGSLDPSSSSLSSFSLEKRTVLSLLVFLPNVKWKITSISITVLLSRVPVCLGPEDATGVVLTIFRGADLVLMSHLKVTKSQVLGGAVSLALDLLSLCLRVLASFYDVMVMFVELFNFSLYCSLNV